MSNTNLRLNTSELIFWFNAVRNNKCDTKLLDAFWDGQIASKCWLVNELNSINYYKESNIYIFGGWVGILASMLFQCSKFPVRKIRSIDLDSWCEKIADDICKVHEMNDWRFKAITDDMANYQYDDDIYPDIVINTSTEHVSEGTYSKWYNKIPADTLIIAQGNNFFNCDGHVRCSNSLQEFKSQNNCINTIFEGELNLDSYTRYMCIWRKNS